MNAESIDSSGALRGKDLTGSRFVRLTVDSFAGRIRLANGTLKKVWLCRCECGETKIVTHGNLLNGLTKSCGCLKSEVSSATSTTHGLRRSPLYGTWAAMKKRCLNPNNRDWKHYGGRGIKVCDRWLDFASFYADMFPGWSEGMTIERKENDGNYEPGNVRWATQLEQKNNMRKSVFVTFQGRRMTVTQLGREIGLSLKQMNNIYHRLRVGCSNDDALRGFIVPEPSQ